MSGSRLNPAERQLAEQHLGDRLAALVDGELGHDTRERVLAHLATCAKCKAEADAQRRLKSVFAEVAPPPPSESFLARLQGLSGADGPDGGDSPFDRGDQAGPFGRGDGGGPLGRGDRGGPLGRAERSGAFGRGGKGDPFGGPLAEGVFGVRDEGGLGPRPDSFSYAPAGGRGGLLPGGDRASGFRIHDVGRGGERAASRGRRFAFAAAGAVSLAAIALGGVAGMPVDSAESRGGANASPLRSQGAGAAAAAESNRRRGGAQGSGTQAPGKLPAPVATTGVAAPGLPGQHPLTLSAPMLNRAPGLPPLIRPVTATLPYSPLRPLKQPADRPFAAPLASSSAPSDVGGSASPPETGSEPALAASSATHGPGEAPSPSPSAGLSLRAH